MSTEIETMGQETPEIPKKLEITTEIGEQLKRAGGWAMFLSILGFVAVGFMVMAGVVVSIVFAALPGDLTNALPFPSFLLGLIYLVFAAVYLIPVLYLFRFSNGIKKAVQQSDQDQLGKAFTNLKAHYRFFGILTIAMIVLYFVFLFVMIFAGFFAGMASGFPGLHA